MEKKLYHFELRLDRSENKMLHQNARSAGMYCSEYLRNLIKGFVPKQTPRVDFYPFVQRLNKICDTFPEDNESGNELKTIIAELQEMFINKESVCTISFKKA